mgnify:CR=1 FL=1
MCITDRSEIDDLLKAGAADFVKKPFDIREVVSRMTDLLGMQESGSTNGTGH